MLDYNIINNKNIVMHNNNKYIDLLSTTFNKDIKLSGSFVYINEYYVARPDLVSLVKYGTDKYADIICKVNGISNPFELNKGVYLYIPNIEILDNLLEINNHESDFIDNTVNDKLYNNTTINYQKNKNETRSPNNQIVGKTNYVIDKSLGVIFY